MKRFVLVDQRTNSPENLSFIEGRVKSIEENAGMTCRVAFSPDNLEIYTLAEIDLQPEFSSDLERIHLIFTSH